MWQPEDVLRPHCRESCRGHFRKVLNICSMVSVPYFRSVQLLLGPGWASCPGRSTVRHCSVAAKRHHDHANSKRKALNWGLTYIFRGLSSSMIVMAASMCVASMLLVKGLRSMNIRQRGGAWQQAERRGLAWAWAVLIQTTTGAEPARTGFCMFVCFNVRVYACKHVWGCTRV